MYSQFINYFADSRVYLLTSLWLFLAFFVLVAVMLIKTSKKHIDYMSELPLNEDDKI